jgi:cellulose synthase (UDP-forming)
MISEVGVEVALTQGITISVDEMPVMLEIMEEQIQLPGKILQIGFRDEFPTVRVLFEQVSLSQQRRLVEMLFCRPGQWKRHCTPGELSSLLLLFRILLKPRILFDRRLEVNAIAVSQG